MPSQQYQNCEREAERRIGYADRVAFRFAGSEATGEGSIITIANGKVFPTSAYSKGGSFVISTSSLPGLIGIAPKLTDEMQNADQIDLLLSRISFLINSSPPTSFPPQLELSS